MTVRKLTTPQLRIKKQKDMMIEFLKKNPVIQAACEKLDIGRATHYRWYKEDPEYAKRIDEAVIEGITLCNDYAESQLLSAIQSGDTNATKFFLRANHPRYKNKVEVNGNLTVRKDPMSEEQQELSALALVRIMTPVKESIETHSNHINPHEDKNQHEHLE